MSSFNQFSPWRPKRRPEGAPPPESHTEGNNALFNHRLGLKLAELPPPQPVTTLAQMDEEKRERLKAELLAREAQRRADPLKARAAQLEAADKASRRRRR